MYMLCALMLGFLRQPNLHELPEGVAKSSNLH